jgi:hypothetical protein
MSYDIDAFRVPPGRAAEEFLESGDREEMDESPPTAEERSRMERIATALHAIDPQAVRADGEDFVEISTDALQVSVYAREAAVTIPYWFTGDAAETVLARAFAYARVLEDEGGFTVSDPQTGQIVDFATLDLHDVARVYARGVQVVDDMREQSKRPWWKLRRS